MTLRSLVSLCVLCVLCGESFSADPGPWATYRGNPQRTGNTDNVAGPEKPAILWSVKSQDHFVASPVPVKDTIYVAGIGAFNRPSASLFPLAGKTPAAATWVKSAPYLKLASVSSPAVAGDYLLFGDGIHQDSGGVLHCVNATTSKPLWQLVLPGDLIHLEGAPVVAGNKVFIGGGAAGALCVEMDKALLDGKEYDLATVAKMQEAKWKELNTKYEEAKAKKDDFAIPPDDSQLLKFVPKKVWQKGEKKWHVDAAVNFAGDKLLVPTAYLDKEKVGERALYALNAANGETVWKAELKFNPWGGATVAGDLVIVPESSVGYYYKELKGAKGAVTALDLKTGAEKWRKEIPTGGVLGCVAVSDGLAVATATDGKVRAGMGTDLADYNGDGRLDLVVTNFEFEGHNLFRNLGDGLFADASYETGVAVSTLPFLGFGVAFLDYDNDTDLDLAIANGHVLDNTSLFRASSRHGQRNLLLVNDGTGFFRDAGAAAGPGFALEKVSRTLVTGDIDNDGDLDLLVTNNGQTADLLRNDGGHRRGALSVRLVGRQSNRDGIGARVRATVGGRVQTREVKAGSSYLGQGDTRVHVGLGGAVGVGRLEVRWPTGVTEVIGAVEGGQVVTVTEGLGITARTPFATR